MLSLLQQALVVVVSYADYADYADYAAGSVRNKNAFTLFPDWPSFR